MENTWRLQHTNDHFKYYECINKKKCKCKASKILNVVTGNLKIDDVHSKKCVKNGFKNSEMPESQEQKYVPEEKFNDLLNMVKKLTKELDDEKNKISQLMTTYTKKLDDDKQKISQLMMTCEEERKEKKRIEELYNQNKTKLDEKPSSKCDFSIDNLCSFEGERHGKTFDSVSSISQINGSQWSQCSFRRELITKKAPSQLSSESDFQTEKFRMLKEKENLKKSNFKIRNGGYNYDFLMHNEFYIGEISTMDETQIANESHASYLLYLVEQKRSMQKKELINFFKELKLKIEEKASLWIPPKPFEIQKQKLKKRPHGLFSHPPIAKCRMCFTINDHLKCCNYSNLKNGLKKIKDWHKLNEDCPNCKSAIIHLTEYKCGDCKNFIKRKNMDRHFDWCKKSSFTKEFCLTCKRECVKIIDYDNETLIHEHKCHKKAKIQTAKQTSNRRRKIRMLNKFGRKPGERKNKPNFDPNAKSVLSYVYLKRITHDYVNEERLVRMKISKILREGFPKEYVFALCHDDSYSTRFKRVFAKHHDIISYPPNRPQLSTDLLFAIMNKHSAVLKTLNFSEDNSELNELLEKGAHTASNYLKRKPIPPERKVIVYENDLTTLVKAIQMRMRIDAMFPR